MRAPVFAAWRRRIPESVRRVDILLTHLHMDHIQGLGFFAPLYRPDLEAHIWGPGSVTLRFAGAPHALPFAPAVSGKPL